MTTRITLILLALALPITAQQGTSQATTKPAANFC